MAKVSDAGGTSSFAWATSGGSASPNYLFGLALAGASVAIAGSTRPPASYGPLLIPSSGAKVPDIYYPMAAVATLADPTLLATAALPTLTPYPNPAHERVTVALPAGVSTLQLLDAGGPGSAHGFEYCFASPPHHRVRPQRRSIRCLCATADGRRGYHYPPRSVLGRPCCLPLTSLTAKSPRQCLARAFLYPTGALIRGRWGSRPCGHRGRRLLPTPPNYPWPGRGRPARRRACAPRSCRYG